MNVSEPHQVESGLWCITVDVGHADDLLAALDPDHAFVLIETWDGDPDWHEVVVSAGGADSPRTRFVRRHSFDLLVTPAEAVEIGVHLRNEGVAGGGLSCYQFRQPPKATFRLPDSAKGHADALHGQGVAIAIDLPHDSETAVPLFDFHLAYLRSGTARGDFWPLRVTPRRTQRGASSGGRIAS